MTGYALAVADGLLFSLAPKVWQRLSAHDPAVDVERLRDTIARAGVRPSFGDGEVVEISESIGEELRGLLDRIRDAAASSLVDGADTLDRILCTDPWPRIYTTAVLDVPSASPIHVVQASDVSDDLAWSNVCRLIRMPAVRALMMPSCALGRLPWPTGASLAELRAIDLSDGGLRHVPSELARAANLEAIELAGNRIAPGSLAPLAALSKLRYIGLARTGLARRDLPRLPGCDFQLG